MAMSSTSAAICGVTSRRLASASKSKRVREEMLALYDLGMVNIKMGLHAEAESCLKQSLAIARKIRNAKTQARILTTLGTLSAKQGRYTEGMDHLRASLEICAKLQDEQGKRGALLKLESLFRMWSSKPGDRTYELELVELVREMGYAKTYDDAIKNLDILYGNWLVLASENNDVKRFRELLKKKVNVNTRARSGHTPLTAAAGTAVLKW